jgi:sulfate permease, SulP family
MPFGWLRGYRPDWLSRDVVAGLTVWAVLVPESLAYASIAGVSPVVGLYAAPAALVLYAAFGSSRHLIVGPMSATAALSAAIVADFALPGDDLFTTTTVALALVVGVVALVAGLLRLGFVANFISEPVLKGFIVGLALTILAGQLPKLFGVEGGAGNFFERIVELVRHLGETNVPTLVLGLVCLALVIGLKEWLPVVPGALVAVAVGIGAVTLLGLDEQGVAIVGTIPSGLPPVGVPSLDINRYLALVAPALGVVVIGFAEGLGAAKAYATRLHYEVDANRELIGLGASNVGSGLMSGMIVNGSLSKTAVNGGAGARSQLSSLIVAALVVVTLLFLTGLFESLPETTLAAIVIAAVVELVDVRSLVGLYRLTTDRLGGIYGLAARADFIAAVTALLGVLILDTLPGLILGVFASIALVVYRSARPNVAVLGRLPGESGAFVDVARHANAVQMPGIVILRPEAGLFFANAEHLRAVMRRHAFAPGIHALILDFQTVPELDVTAARMIGEFVEDAGRRDVRVLFARDIGQVRDLLEATHHGRLPPVYATVAEAVAALGGDPHPSVGSGSVNDPG